MSISKITPFLWFDTQAEEAAHFDTSIFPNSRVGDVHRYGEAGPGPAGSVMIIHFELDGQKFVGLNGGPIHKFTEAVSFAVNCDTQDEIDHYWTALTAEGAEVECGWLKDKYGLSWQVAPSVLPQLLGGDAARSARVMQAIWGMKKFDIAALQQAAQSA